MKTSASACLTVLVLVGCGSDEALFSSGSGTGGATSTSSSSSGGGQGGAVSSTATGQGGDATSTSSGGGDGGGGAGSTGPGGAGGGTSSSTSTSTSTSTGVGGGPVCLEQCGPVELCDDDHLGLDDDCDGQVDESCPCIPGEAEGCFKGDPSYVSAPGCHPGSAVCSANGTWGACVGGVHATDSCFTNDLTVCHALTAPPYQSVDLGTGLGNFDSNALSHTFQVSCPPGVAPCPGLAGDLFSPLQLGEYTIKYTKQIQGGGSDSCSFPLIVGQRGLHAELMWEHDLGADGVDLDLHMHQPNDVLPWATAGATQDCGWANCAENAYEFMNPGVADWFNGVAPPDPVDWFLDPVLTDNLCYFEPRNGAAWQQLGLGCHNPRLDSDSITCNPLVTDVTAFDFCVPESVSVDYPPTEAWTRLGVHYYSSHGLLYDVHPRVKVFCDGELAADLGPNGYNAPVTFTAADGQAPGTTTFWMATDVAVHETPCGRRCKVVPLYADNVSKTPLKVLQGQAEASFGPSYPPPP